MNFESHPPDSTPDASFREEAAPPEPSSAMGSTSVRGSTSAMGSTPAADPTPATAPMGWARLVSIVHRPGATFEAVARRPQPWIPIVALALLVGVGSALIAHISGPEQMEMMLHSKWGERLANDPDFDQKLDDARHPSVAGRVTSGLSGAVGVVFMVAVTSFFYWLMCLVLGGRQGFQRTLDVVALGSWIGSGVGFAATLPLILAKGSVMSVGYSLAPLLALFGGDADPQGFGYRLLQSFTNGFAIWQLVLMAIGFAIVHQMGRGRGWVAALVPWLIGSALSLWIASLTM